MTAIDRFDEIAAFYDLHPYPPPVVDLRQYRGRGGAERRRVEHHRLWPNRGLRDDRDILIAGCGTSQAAKWALRHPGSRVVGIDVSATSIAMTRRLAERHDLGNLELHRLPLEAVEGLGRTFDLIVCTGVLHHLAEPEAGLLALCRVLAPGGALDGMVYARYGRTGVAMLQEYCRLLGIRPDPAEIDELVATLRELPVGHPLGHLLRTAPDFADDDALADALLNPRERAYSVPELLALLDTAGLRFGRWTRQAPYLPQCGAPSRLPHARRIAARPVADQYAAMELFRGTMVRHSFIAYRADDPASDPRFDDDRSRDFVPVRATTAVAVEAGLPQGVAAALLNRAHTFPDLVLLATAEQKQIWDLIDGHRTIAEISDDVAFVERLWWHDLIVIDASRATPTDTGPGRAPAAD
jgi:SAM-dependent methyltransferase